MKKFYLYKLCLIALAFCLPTKDGYADPFSKADSLCFHDDLNMKLSAPVLGQTAPVFFACESKEAAIYALKALESKNKIQMEKAESVCKEITEIGKITEIFYTVTTPLPEERKTAVIAAVNLVDDLFGKSYFAIAAGCDEESEEHRAKRLNQAKVAEMCSRQDQLCELITQEDIRKSKTLRRLNAAPGDAVVSKKLIKSDDIDALIEAISKSSESQRSEVEGDRKDTVKASNDLTVLDALATEKATAKALDKMTTRISQSWRRPNAYKGGREVLLRMSLTSDGNLDDVRVVRSSGDILFDRSAVTAVKKAAPFREIENFDQTTFDEKFKSVTVKFRPED